MIGPTGGYEKHRVTSEAEAYYNLNILFYQELISDLDQEWYVISLQSLQ